MYPAANGIVISNEIEFVAIVRGKVLHLGQRWMRQPTAGAITPQHLPRIAEPAV
jgi:hypothetical protein